MTGKKGGITSKKGQLGRQCGARRPPVPSPSGAIIRLVQLVGGSPLEHSAGKQCQYGMLMGSYGILTVDMVNNQLIMANSQLITIC